MIGVPANRLELLTHFYYKQRIDPRTYTQIKDGGGGGGGTPP